MKFSTLFTASSGLTTVCAIIIDAAGADRLPLRLRARSAAGPYRQELRRRPVFRIPLSPSRGSSSCGKVDAG
jgi:hypothetical protein